MRYIQSAYLLVTSPIMPFNALVMPECMLASGMILQTSQGSCRTPMPGRASPENLSLCLLHLPIAHCAFTMAGLIRRCCPLLRSHKLLLKLYMTGPSSLVGQLLSSAWAASRARPALPCDCRNQDTLSAVLLFDSGMQMTQHANAHHIPLQYQHATLCHAGCHMSCLGLTPLHLIAVQGMAALRRLSICLSAACCPSRCAPHQLCHFRILLSLHKFVLAYSSLHIQPMSRGLLCPRSSQL